MEKKAKIYTYTVIHTSSVDFADKCPYAVGVLDDGEKRFSAFIEGYQDGMEITIGQEVKYLKDDENGKPVFKFV